MGGGPLSYLSVGMEEFLCVLSLTPCFNARYPLTPYSFDKFWGTAVPPAAGYIDHRTARRTACYSPRAPALIPISSDCLLHQVRELPYWWAPDVRPLWDERAGNYGAIMPRGSIRGTRTG